MNDWITNELIQQTLDTPKSTIEKLPSLTFEEGKIIEISVDFSKPFEKWFDEDNETNKAIIPVLHDGIKKNWWLNKKNPFYRVLLEKGKEGHSQFKIIKTGQKRGTRYSLVE